MVSGSSWRARANPDPVAAPPAISLWWCMCQDTSCSVGTTLTVPTLTSSVSLRVPPGTTNGRKFRVKGAGVQRKDVPGDLIVTVEISVPQKLSSEARTALEAFANAQQADPREAITKALRSRSGTSTAGAAAS